MRLSFGLTQVEFAQKIGLSKNYISLLENGQREPGERTANDICRIFRIRKEWLTTGEGEMRQPMSQEEEFAYKVGAALGSEGTLTKAVVEMLISRSPAELEALEGAIRAIYESL